MTSTAEERIVLNPEILFGKPTIKGTRISVELILELLKNGWTHEDILQNYPTLTNDDILACLAYAWDVVSQERVFPSAA